jgi:hypothetical protein
LEINKTVIVASSWSSIFTVPKVITLFCVGMVTSFEKYEIRRRHKIPNVCCSDSQESGMSGVPGHTLGTTVLSLRAAHGADGREETIWYSAGSSSTFCTKDLPPYDPVLFQLKLLTEFQASS